MKTEGKDFTHFTKAFNELQELAFKISDLRIKVRECKLIVFKYCSASADKNENDQRFSDLQAYANDKTSIANIVQSCAYFEDQLEEFSDKRKELSSQLYEISDSAGFKQISAKCRDIILKLKTFGVQVRSLHLAMIQFVGLQLDNDNQFSTLCDAFDVVVQDMHNGNEKASVFVGQYQAYMLDWVYQTGFFDGME